MSRISKKRKTNKRDIEKIRNKRKTKTRIQQLFQDLRRDLSDSISEQSILSTSFNTPNTTVILVDDSVDNNLKRKYDDATLNSEWETTLLNKTDSGTETNQAKKPRTDCIINTENEDNDIIVIKEPTDEKYHTIIVPDDDPVKNSINLTPSQSTPKRNPKLLHSSTPISNNNTIAQNFNQEIVNLTRDINGDYESIDLTCDVKPTVSKTVINLTDTVDDCTFVSESNSSVTLSGDSAVTVIKQAKNKQSERHIRRFANGIARLDANDKGKLLELITESIFNGCAVPDSVKSKLNMKSAQESKENTYIKEVILGQSVSRNSIGSNIYNPEREIKQKTGPRMIVIDGSNVAMTHGGGRMFSVKGLKICIDYFVSRGHDVKAFVPHFRCKFGKSSDPRLLDYLSEQGLVIYTPSREIEGRMITSYDDRYIIQCAAEFDGVIVSGDRFRDLIHENPRWRYVIENRLLPFTFVQNMIMFPQDPLGRNGPTLRFFLNHHPST